MSEIELYRDEEILKIIKEDDVRAFVDYITISNILVNITNNTNYLREILFIVLQNGSANIFKYLEINYKILDSLKTFGITDILHHVMIGYHNLLNNKEGYINNIDEIFENYIINKINIQDYINKFSIYDTTPFIDAIMAGHLELVNFLLEHGADIDNRVSGNGQFGGFRPIHLAIIAGNMELVNFLLEHGADIDNRVPGDGQFGGVSPLHLAVMTGNIELVNFLLEHGADINSYISGNVPFGGVFPLHLAVMTGNIELVNFLLEHGANINSHISGNVPFGGVFPLHLAVMTGNLEILRFLIEHGADTSQLFYRNYYGEATIFDMAIISGNKDIINYLISKKIVEEIAVRSNNAPIIGYIKSINSKISNFIPKMPLPLKILNNFKYEILAKAVKNDNVLFVKFLLKNGVNPNIRPDIVNKKPEIFDRSEEIEFGPVGYYLTKILDSENVIHSLPLIYLAIDKGNIEIIKALVEAGADVNFKNEKTSLLDYCYQTPLDYAYEKGNPVIIKYLEGKGVKKNKEKELAYFQLVLCMCCAFIIKNMEKQNSLQLVLEATTSSNEEMAEATSEHKQHEKSMGGN